MPLPPFWGGFRLVPAVVEFWHHWEDRLHDRIRYRREDGNWVMERLAPSRR
jgi:pyridoxamine 5'-phosphate oxidase